MKDNNPLKTGAINITLTVIFLLILVTFSQLESMVLAIASLILILLTSFSSLRGLFLSIKVYKNKGITRAVFLLSILLNSIFPLVLLLLLISNLTDVIKLFSL
jgi:hypothetical protein